MNNRPSPTDPLAARLKCLIVDTLKLRSVNAAEIADDEPLIGGGLGLDSLDELELAMRLEDEFGITIHTRSESGAAFATIASLAAFIRERQLTEPLPELLHAPARPLGLARAG